MAPKSCAENSLLYKYKLPPLPPPRFPPFPPFSVAGRIAAHAALSSAVLRAPSAGDELKIILGRGEPGTGEADYAPLIRAAQLSGGAG